MSHHSVTTIASSTVNLVNPPSRPLTATMPATIQNAAMIQPQADILCWVRRRPLIVVCRMCASLESGSPADAGVIRQNG